MELRSKPWRHAGRRHRAEQGSAKTRRLARNQACIALGNLLTTAALLGVDACPMEGFASALIATLGYRSADDKYAEAPKVRFPKEQVFSRI